MILYHQFIQNFETNMETYHIPASVNSIQPMVDDLSTWYIRRSRDRFVQGEEQAFATLYYVLRQLIRAASPAMPFIAETIYQNLRLDNEPESVHLCDWPEVDQKLIDKKLLEQMQVVREIVEKGHAARREAKIKIKQPVATITIEYSVGTTGQLSLSNGLIQTIKDELNVKEVVLKTKNDGEVVVNLDTELTKELIIEGLAREIRREIQSLRRKAAYDRDAKITVYWQSDSDSIQRTWTIHGEEIAKEVLAEAMVNEKTEKVDRDSVLELDSQELWLGVRNG